MSGPGGPDGPKRGDGPEAVGGPGGGGEPPAGRSGGGALRAWLIGARPHTLPAAAAPVLVGGGYALSEGAFALLPFLAALAGAFCLQIGANFANDYFDWVQGADHEGRRGFLRVTQSGMVSPERVRRWMAGAFAASVVPGLYLVLHAGWPILVVGLASIAAAVAYTGGPYPLGYHGLGEPFVFVFFGLVAVGGTHYVQALRFEPGTLWAGAGVGALATAILVVNNLRDIPSDRSAGKRTLAVRMGVAPSRMEYAGLLAATLLVPPVGVAWLGWSPWALAACGAALALASPLRTVFRSRAPEALNRALSATGRALGLYGLLLGAGLPL